MSNFLIQRFLERLKSYNISFSCEKTDQGFVVDIFNIPLGLDIALARLSIREYVRTDKTYNERTGEVIDSSIVYDYENCCKPVNSDAFPKRNFIRVILDEKYYCNKMNMIDKCIRDYRLNNGWQQ